MEYRKLGNTDLDVSLICLGTMTWGQQNSLDDALQQLDYALAQGVNFIDTAEMYPVPPRAETQGRTEECIGEWFARRGTRQRVILATKVSGRSDAQGDWKHLRGGPQLSRDHIRQAVRDSLKRLRTDYIDLYQVHRPSPEIPVDETLGALTDLVRAGKVRYIGCSTHPAWMVMEALAVSERAGLARYVSEQPPYNLLDRRIENELVPLAQRHGLALLPWAPLAQGVLAGRYRAGTALPEDSRAARQPGSIYAERVTTRGIEAGTRFAELAAARGRTPGQLALLWCRDQPAVTAPIVGPRTLAQLQDVLPVLEMSLSGEERSACDAINPPGGVLVNFHNTAPWMKTPIT